MVHKPIAIMILPILVAGILMLGILAATARGEDNNTGGGETQAPPAGGGETQAPPAGGGETQAPPATETPTPPTTPTSGCGPGTDNSTCSTTPTPVPTPPPTTPTPTTGASNNTGNAAASQGATNNESRADFVNTILGINNRERAAVGVPPLVWSDSLAAGSQTWAEHLVQINQAVHSSANFKDYGELLAQLNVASSGKSFPPISTESLVQVWVNEKKDWHGGVFTQENCCNPMVTHYTQMVWKTTKEVGCATGITKAGVPPGQVGETVYLVCRYTPHGNNFGQSPY